MYTPPTSPTHKHYQQLNIMEKCIPLFLFFVSSLVAIEGWRDYSQVSGSSRLVVVNRQPTTKKTGFINNDGQIALSESSDNGQTWTKW